MTRPHGVYLNQPQAQCSIYESGMMVFRALENSDRYTLEYFALSPETAHAIPKADFYIMNYHHATMQWLDTASVRALPGKVLTVVLEMLPGNPFVYVSPDHFDAYVVLDPTIAIEHPHVYAFPRPLEAQAASAPYTEKEIPWIGSFGFSTPGKGFELVVDAVNREFDRAKVRINIPPGTFADSHAALLQRRNYAEYLTELCTRVAKPGIEVEVTQAFMSKQELIDWCAQNTLNCFLYCRNQPGLSATTDQCISAGRPLAVSANETFRHLHQYLLPYPERSLRDAIACSEPEVARMRAEWTPRGFANRFAEVLQRLGVIQPEVTIERWSPPALPAKRPVKLAFPASMSVSEQLLSVAAAGAIQRSRFFRSAAPDETLAITLAIGSAAAAPESTALRLIPSESGAVTLAAASESWQLPPLLPLHCNEQLLQDRPLIGAFFSAPNLAEARVLFDALSASPLAGDVYISVPGLDAEGQTAFLQALLHNVPLSPQWGIRQPPAANTPIEILSAMSACTALAQPLSAPADTALFGYALATQRPVGLLSCSTGPELQQRLAPLLLEQLGLAALLAGGIAPLVPLYNDWSETRFIGALQRAVQHSEARDGEPRDERDLDVEQFLLRQTSALMGGARRILQINTGSMAALNQLSRDRTQVEAIEAERNYSLEEFYELPTTVFESYDLIVGSAEAANCPDPELFFAEVGDLLAPGGSAVLSLGTALAIDLAAVNERFVELVGGASLDERASQSLADGVGIVLKKRCEASR